MIKLMYIATVLVNGLLIVSSTGIKKCKKNERWEECPDSLCIPKTCAELGFPLNCPPRNDGCDDDCRGQPSCICNEGYVRNNKGICIPSSQCPSCGGDANAQPGCGVNCGRLCSNYDKGPVACPAICMLNGCDCKKEYVYDSNIKECVLPEQCSPSCGPNEVFSTCANGGCGKWNCTQIGQPDLCIDPIECENGCICRSGYLRDCNGICIPENQCHTDICTKANEVYDECPASCPFRTCGIDDRVIFCAQGPQPGDPDCPSPTCRCQDGFYRDHNGECVTWDQCPICSKRNEVYDPCPAPCPPRRCDVDDRLIKCAAPPKLGDPACQPACRCIDGYVRNDKGICVTRDECPKCTGAHEVYNACPETCPPQTCESKGKVYWCPAQSKCKQCQGACMCESGYYRNKIGECVTEDDCSISETTTPLPDCSNNTLSSLYQGINVFTAKFLYEVVKNKPNSNLIMSPASVFIPMGQLALYAYGDTYDQLMQALNLKSKDEIRCLFPLLYNILKDQSEVVFNLAARIFADSDYPLSKNFLDDSKNVFGSEAENVDFSNPGAAAERINAWAANETNNRITDVATPDMFNSMTRLVLANAIYFLGNWQSQFNPNDTKDRDFHMADNTTIKLPTMFQNGKFKYAEISNLDCKVLELPYKGNFSFFIFLPNTNDGVPVLLEKFLDVKVLDNAYNNMSNETVNVYLPKINVTMETDLSKIMNEIGIVSIFSPSDADLTGIMEREETLYVSAAKQKAFILVNEVGTEAAAVNVIVVSTTSVTYPPPKIYTFKANKPYIFYLMHEGHPMFCGVFANAQ